MRALFRTFWAYAWRTMAANAMWGLLGTMFPPTTSAARIFGLIGWLCTVLLAWLEAFDVTTRKWRR